MNLSESVLFLLHDPVHYQSMEKELLAHSIREKVEVLALSKISPCDGDLTRDERILEIAKMCGLEPYELPQLIILEKTKSEGRVLDLSGLKEGTKLHCLPTSPQTLEEELDTLLLEVSGPSGHSAVGPLKRLAARAIVPIGAMALAGFFLKRVLRPATKSPKTKRASQHPLSVEYEWPWQITEEQLELETRNSLNAALKLEALNFEHIPTTIGAYCRAIEAEFNASLVQEIRSSLGISMPQYFMRHCPGGHALFNQNGIKIDMNQKHNSTWRPPGLGQSRIVAEGLEIPSLREYPRIKNTWAEIARLRNLAAHPSQSLVHHDHELCREHIDELLGATLGSHLIAVKEALSDRRVTHTPNSGS